MVSSNTFRNSALLALRLVVAVTFLHGGYAKGFIWSADPASMGMSVPMWQLMKFLSIAEPIGGAAIALGVLTRTAATCNAIIMIGALWIMGHTYGTSYFTLPQAPGLDFNAHLLAESLVLAAFGPGQWAIDMLWKRRTKGS
jgi:putative oxidoreductase